MADQIDKKNILPIGLSTGSRLNPTHIHTGIVQWFEQFKQTANFIRCRHHNGGFVLTAGRVTVSANDEKPRGVVAFVFDPGRQDIDVV